MLLPTPAPRPTALSALPDHSSNRSPQVQNPRDLPPIPEITNHAQPRLRIQPHQNRGRDDPVSLRHLRALKHVHNLHPPNPRHPTARAPTQAAYAPTATAHCQPPHTNATPPRLAPARPRHRSPPHLTSPAQPPATTHPPAARRDPPTAPRAETATADNAQKRNDSPTHNSDTPSLAAQRQRSQRPRTHTRQFLPQTIAARTRAGHPQPPGRLRNRLCVLIIRALDAHERLLLWPADPHPPERTV